MCEVLPSGRRGNPHTPRCQAVWPAHHTNSYIYFKVFYSFVIIIILFYFFFSFLFKGSALIVVLPPGEALYISSLSFSSSLFSFSFFISFSYARMKKYEKKQKKHNNNNLLEKEKEMKYIRKRENILILISPLGSLFLFFCASIRVLLLLF